MAIIITWFCCVSLRHNHKMKGHDINLAMKPSYSVDQFDRDNHCFWNSFLLGTATIMSRCMSLLSAFPFFLIVFWLLQVLWVNLILVAIHAPVKMAEPASLAVAASKNGPLELAREMALVQKNLSIKLSVMSSPSNVSLIHTYTSIIIFETTFRHGLP